MILKKEHIHHFTARRHTNQPSASLIARQPYVAPVTPGPSFVDFLCTPTQSSLHATHAITSPRQPQGIVIIQKLRNLAKVSPRSSLDPTLRALFPNHTTRQFWTIMVSTNMCSPGDIDKLAQSILELLQSNDSEISQIMGACVGLVRTLIVCGSPSSPPVTTALYTCSAAALNSPVLLAIGPWIFFG
jgi:hypothetical protein